jgi:translation initiation factor IF-2
VYGYGGKISRNSRIRIIEGVVVHGELIALKRFKDDVKKWPGMIVVSK